jgi:ribonuclease Z
MGMMGRHAAVSLYGPVPLQEMMEQHLSFFGPLPFELRFQCMQSDWEGPIFEDEKLTVLPILLKHRTLTFGYLFREKQRALNVRKDRIRQYGLGIADLVKVKLGEDHVDGQGRVIPNRELTLPPYRQRSYAYVSDTAFDPSLAQQLRNVDLLFHEATFSKRDEKLALQTLHSTSVQAATLAKLSGAEKLLIGHFSNRYKDHDHLVEEAREIFPDTDGVNDGDTYSVPLRRMATE